MPPELHCELRRRAERAGMTVRDYVLSLIERDQRRPTLGEWLEEVTADDAVVLERPAAETIAADREDRDMELAGRAGGGRGRSRR